MLVKPKSKHVIYVLSETGRKTKKNSTDPFEVAWADVYSDIKRECPAVIKRDDKLRREHYGFVKDRYENNITPHARM